MTDYPRLVAMGRGRLPDPPTSFLLYLRVWLWSRRAHPDAWERWRQVVDETGVLGFIAFRHIPRDMDRESAA